MGLTILLRCRDLPETREFYRAVLGFEVRDTAENTVSVTKHGGTLIFTASDLWAQPPGCSGTLYFGVPDVDGYFATLKDRATIAWPLQDMPYGSREFGVVDCNGYHLAFQQSATGITEPPRN